MVYLFPLRTNSQLLALFFYYNMYFVFSEISIFLIPWHSRGLRIDLSIHYRKITFQIFRFCRSLPLYNMLLLCRITRSTFIVCIRFSRSSSSLSFCECYPARHYSVLSSLFFCSPQTNRSIFSVCHSRLSVLWYFARISVCLQQTFVIIGHFFKSFGFSYNAISADPAIEIARRQQKST